MPIQVEFNNSIIEFPDGMSQSEITEILQSEQAKLSASEISDLPNKTKEDYEDNYIKGRAKIGVGTGVAFLQAIGETALDTLSKGSGGQTWTEFGAEFSKNMKENQEEQVDKLTNLFGWDKPDLELQPADKYEQILGLGAEMATDPLLLVSKSKSIGELAVRGGIRAGQWFGIGTVAGAAGEAGAQAEELFTGEDTGFGRTIGTIGSTLISAKTSGPAFIKLEDKANALLKNMSNPINNIRGKATDAGQAFAIANSKSILREISKAEKKDIEKVMEDFGQISHYFNDVEIPFFVTMANNPVAKGELNKLIRKDPSVRARVDKELIKITDAIEEKSNFLFGAPVSGKELTQSFETADVRKSLMNRLSTIKKARAETSEKIESLGSSLMPSLTKEERGFEIASLIEKNKAQAKAIRSKEYTEIINQAKKAKVFMPPEGVESIYNFVKSVKLSNIFGKGTSLDNKITTYLKPKKVPYKTTDSAGNKIMKNKLVYPKLSFSNVDSLKKAINFELRRSSLSNDVRRQLEDLKDVLFKARETIPGPYNAALKLADDNYYNFIGIPYTKQGIREIDSKKYASQIAPVVVKDSESLQQFLDVVPGDKGLNIARNALLSQVHFKAVKNGAVNPSDINKIIKDKKDVIDLIPGMREELERSAKHQGYLSSRVDTLNDVIRSQEKKIGDHFLIKNGGVEGLEPSKIVSDLIANRGKLVKVLNDINKLEPAIKKPVLNTLRRQFIANITDKPGGSMNWLLNKDNKFVVDRLMGKNYQLELKSFARISDKLRSLDLEKVANMPTGAVYDWAARKFPGLDLPSIVATIRRPIISPFQKGVILASRVFTGGRGARSDKQLEELLFTDLEGIKAFAKLEAKYKNKMDAMSLLKDYSNIAGEILPKFIYAGIKEAVLNEEGSEQLRQQQEETLQGAFSY